MPLQYQDQVNLIKDILTNQQTDCCGSVSEYEQLERLIKSLMVNNQCQSTGCTGSCTNLFL